MFKKSQNDRASINNDVFQALMAHQRAQMQFGSGIKRSNKRNSINDDVFRALMAYQEARMQFGSKNRQPGSAAQ